MSSSSLLVPLRMLGIGVSQRVTLHRGVGRTPWPLRVVANQALSCGSSVALVPATALWDVNALLDLDADGLVPDPAEMLAVVGDRYPSLDTFYMAYFLACQAYRTHPGWQADRLRDILDTFPAIASPHGLGETLSHEAALLQRFSQDFATPPLDAFLAAFYYAKTCTFHMPAATEASEATEKSHAGSPEVPQRRLVCAALVDVLPRALTSASDPGSGAGAGSLSPNVALRPLSLEGTTLADWATANKLHGARQAMKGKDTKRDFWHLEMTCDVPPGTPLVLPKDVLLTPP